MAHVRRRVRVCRDGVVHAVAVQDAHAAEYVEYGRRFTVRYPEVWLRCSGHGEDLRRHVRDGEAIDGLVTCVVAWHG
jgi:hypothetical protein